jgi:DNA-binding GntR family transcriptional regulator
MQKGTRASFIYQDLQRSIVEGVLLPGDPLLEVELSATYNVSRTPIREAIRRLQNDGLVEVTPYSGARVARVSPADVLAAFDARIWLEPPVFARAAENATDSFLESLRSIMSRMPEEPTKRAEAFQAIEADFAFHRAVFESIGNRFVLSLLDDALSVTRRAINLSPPPRFTQAREEHLAIMAAFDAKDGAKAAELVLLHVSNAKRRYSGGYGD